MNQLELVHRINANMVAEFQAAIEIDSNRREALLEIELVQIVSLASYRVLGIQGVPDRIVS